MKMLMLLSFQTNQIQNKEYPTLCCISGHSPQMIQGIGFIPSPFTNMLTSIRPISTPLSHEEDPSHEAFKTMTAVMSRELTAATRPVTSRGRRRPHRRIKKTERRVPRVLTRPGRREINSGRLTSIEAKISMAKMETE